MKVERFSFVANKVWKNLDAAKSLDSDKTLVLAFCAPEMRENESVLQTLTQSFPKAIVVGCSTAGEIRAEGIFDHSISAIAIQFKHSKLKVVVQPSGHKDGSIAVGRQLAKDLIGNGLKGVLLLSEGLGVNGSKLAEGVVEGVNEKSVVIAGGLAGDGSAFHSTWILSEGKIATDRVVAVGMYGGSLKLHHGTKGGWDKFGPEREITRSSGNVLFEIDRRPALELYKEYLGDRASGLPATGLLFPLQIWSRDNLDRKVVRTILAVNEKDQSLTFAGDVPVGHLAQLMRANFDRLIDAAGVAAETVTTQRAAGVESASIAISCVGRRLVLGPRADEEIEALRVALGTDNFLGFYSYGELGPAFQGSPCELHNQSMTILTLEEAA